MRSIPLALYSIAHTCYEWIFVLFRCPRFLPIMARLTEWSFFHSPYLAAKHPRHGSSVSDKALTYGEITLSTIDALLDHIGAGPDDLLLDLGAGRGRVVLYTATKGIPAEGIELLPDLVEAARYAGQDQPLATFHQADLRDANLSRATILWIVGTCWDEDTFSQLSRSLLQLDHQPTIISVSAPIPQLPILERRDGSTSWGRDRFYIQRPPPPGPQNTSTR